MITDWERQRGEARTNGPGALAAVTLAPPPSYTVWGSGFGDFGSNGGNRHAATLDRSLGGFVVGIDTRVDWAP